MAKKEKSGKTAGQLASKALRDPGSLSEAEIKTIAASVLSQRPDKPKSASKSKHPGIYPPPKRKK
jgi:hypothetical protein